MLGFMSNFVAGHLQSSACRGGSWHGPSFHGGDKAEVEGLGLTAHEVHKVGDPNTGHVLIHHVTACCPACTYHPSASSSTSSKHIVNKTIKPCSFHATLSIMLTMTSGDKTVTTVTTTVTTTATVNPEC